MEVKKQIFWKYKDEEIEVDLVKFSNERYATISCNGNKIILPDYVIEALIDTWIENSIKPVDIYSLKKQYIEKNTINWDDETKEKYMPEIEEDFKKWLEGYCYSNERRV